MKKPGAPQMVQFQIKEVKNDEAYSRTPPKKSSKSPTIKK